MRSGARPRRASPTRAARGEEAEAEDRPLTHTERQAVEAYLSYRMKLALHPTATGASFGPESANVVTTHIDDGRWREARHRMDAQRDYSAGGGGANAASLRLHAAEIAAASARGITHAGESSLPRTAPRDSYNARKKWANVSFALPDGASPGASPGGAASVRGGGAWKAVTQRPAVDPYGFFDQPVGLDAIAGSADRMMPT